jgi:hypothetical protein
VNIVIKKCYLFQIPVFPALLKAETLSMVGSMIPNKPFEGESMNLLVSKTFQINYLVQNLSSGVDFLFMYMELSAILDAQLFPTFLRQNSWAQKS